MRGASPRCETRTHGVALRSNRVGVHCRLEDDKDKEDRHVKEENRRKKDKDDSPKSLANMSKPQPFQ